MTRMVMDINSAIADRAMAGDVLVEAELAEVAVADVLSLGMLADEVRRARVGTTVTFGRVLDVKLAGSGAVDAPTSAREIRLAGAPPSMDEAIRAIRRVRERVSEKQVVTGFSIAELIDRARTGWGPLATVLASLKGAGLDAVADLPIDLVEDSAAVGAAVRESGLRVRALTVQRPDMPPVDLLLRARTIAAALPGTPFAPLAREQAVDVPTTGYADVRLVALARLALPAVHVIQVDWPQYGPKLAQVALTFGANDLDRVSPVDDAALGWRRGSVEEVRRNITAAGFTPLEREHPLDVAQGPAA